MEKAVWLRETNLQVDNAEARKRRNPDTNVHDFTPMAIRKPKRQRTHPQRFD